jgi:Ser/Thr protein kinase RdoA (MazF antagonist)
MKALAEALVGGPVTALAPVRGGGNNRVFRVEAGGGTYALKFYPPQSADRRDRLGQEWQALTFLRHHGIAAVPLPLACDAASHAALYEWIEGAPPTDRAAAIAAMAAFFARVQDLRPAGGGIGFGSTPVLCPAQAVEQFEDRLEALAEAPGDVADHLDAVRDAAARAALRARAGLGDAFHLPLERSAQVLSPSDFGLHNMLVEPGGRIRFLDFEYFGWDGPDKAVADMGRHPGSAFSPAERAHLRRLLVKDAAFDRRLALTEPLFGLIWCLILLNEFRPDRRVRRGLAVGSPEALAAEARQLQKSRLLLDQLRHDHDLAAA